MDNKIETPEARAPGPRGMAGRTSQIKIENKNLNKIASEINKDHEKGIEECLVIGGGINFRGLQGSAQGMERTTADYMGMLATCINSMALQDALEAQGLKTRVQTALEIKEIAEPYIRRRAIRHLVQFARSRLHILAVE